MSRKSITYSKSKIFALKIFNIYKILIKRGEFVISKQILRSGTSIGANLAEAIYAISDKDFLSKIHISLKECSETNFWLELLLDSNLLSPVEYEDLNADCIELLKLLTSTAKTVSEKINNSPSPQVVSEDLPPTYLSYL